ncbi:hypothetical protein K2173_006094 [Erythroxylum novogranatense]|uniref:Phosphatidic acid phosphatase type 2/haloperoxidase domain-containing protein n=1 Tax=Erythroxylum novogranatense TaxID=1862640 RepID=A0AAV8TEC8_9ROSI|nr:hypothetical protein K2173_006094 [Erythroxylum novogranatense]
MIRNVAFPAPTLKSHLCQSHRLEEAKPNFRIRFSASKLDFYSELGSCRASLMAQTRTELVKVSAFRDRDSVESVGLSQHEAVVNGPFRSEFMVEGLEITLNRLSKWLVAALLCATLLWRRDDEALWAATGSVLNSVLSITLKRVLNQERPFTSSRSDPGMPSSHAQSIFYTFLFVILSTLQWLGVNEFTLILSAVAITFGCYLSLLRVSQQLHTISQVAVGAAVGSCFFISWFWLWDAFALQAFVSFLWVRMIVIMGAVGFCLSFLLYVIR